jgi:phosphoenolpyruvate carboxykinase (GTP)
MLPFCGYNMGDYFQHWINVGTKSTADKLPKIFFVNWFRKTSGGKWLWPGYGENSRVLAWVFGQCDGVQGKSVETQIGLMPTVDAIDLPAGVTKEDMAELLSVDVAGWKAELADVAANHYPMFGAKLPKELTAELAGLNSRLG